MPGPPAVFAFDGVYDVEIHVYWEPPCEPNGKITLYILTVTSGRKQVQKKELNQNTRSYVVVGLARDTNYKLELAARTSRGDGIPKILSSRTKVLPGKYQFFIIVITLNCRHVRATRQYQLLRHYYLVTRKRISTFFHKTCLRWQPSHFLYALRESNCVQMDKVTGVKSAYSCGCLYKKAVQR